MKLPSRSEKCRIRQAAGQVKRLTGRKRASLQSVAIAFDDPTQTRPYNVDLIAVAIMPKTISASVQNLRLLKNDYLGHLNPTLPAALGTAIAPATFLSRIDERPSLIDPDALRGQVPRVLLRPDRHRAVRA